MAKKFAKKELSLIFLFAIFSLLLMGNAKAYTNGDSQHNITYYFVEEKVADREYNQICRDGFCDLVFNFSYDGSDNPANTVINGDVLKYTLYFVQGFDKFKSLEMYYLKENEENISDYSTVCSNTTLSANETAFTYPQNCSDVLVGSHIKTTEDWMKLENLVLNKSQVIYLNARGYFDISYNEDSFIVDVIPNVTIASNTYVMSEMAWFGGVSCTYRKIINITNLDTGMPIRANSTISLPVDTSTLISQNKLWNNCSNLYVVYKDATPLTRNIRNCNSANTIVEFMAQENISISSSDDKNYSIYYDCSSEPSSPVNLSKVHYYFNDFDTATQGVIPDGWAVTYGGDRCKVMSNIEWGTVLFYYHSPYDPLRSRGECYYTKSIQVPYNVSVEGTLNKSKGYFDWVGAVSQFQSADVDGFQSLALNYPADVIPISFFVTKGYPIIYRKSYYNTVINRRILLNSYINTTSTCNMIDNSSYYVCNATTDWSSGMGGVMGYGDYAGDPSIEGYAIYDNFTIDLTTNVAPNVVLLTEEINTDTSFTVSLPAGTTVVNFISLNKSSKVVMAENQTSEIPIFNITNIGNVAQDFKIKVNQIPSWVALYGDDAYPYSSGVVINTTAQTIISNLGSGSSKGIWLWSNFTNAPKETNTTNLEVSSQQYA